MQDGMMRMRQVESMVIEAGEELVMEPGGYHLMLFKVSDALRDKEQIRVEIMTTEGDKIEFVAKAKPLQ
jgi:copper(I)-binding protein